MSASSATPHALMDHISVVGVEINWISGREGEEVVYTRLLSRIQREVPGMGEMVPISEVNTAEEPTSSPCGSSTGEIPP